MNRNEAWTAGPITVLSADITTEAATDYQAAFVHRHGLPHVCYTDPPWNLGILRTFMNWAGDHGTEADLDKVLSRVAALSSGVRWRAFVEMGKQHLGKMENLLRDEGLRIIRTHPVTYGHRRPSFLIEAAPQIDGESPDFFTPCDIQAGTPDAQTPRICIETFKVRHPGTVPRVIDWTAGQGCTVKAAIDTGAICLAVELNPARASKALAIAAKRWEPIRSL